jgi:hypothetical protein
MKNATDNFSSVSSLEDNKYKMIDHSNSIIQIHN